MYYLLCKNYLPFKTHFPCCDSVCCFQKILQKYIVNKFFSLFYKVGMPLTFFFFHQNKAVSCLMQGCKCLKWILFLSYRLFKLSGADPKFRTVVTGEKRVWLGTGKITSSLHWQKHSFIIWKDVDIFCSMISVIPYYNIITYHGEKS